MNVAIIPARGGSKRIPRKNVKAFCGKPMIARSIQAARDSGLFGRIVVSTDDDEIAAVSLSAGAEVPFRRPPELAGDYTPTLPVVSHAIDALQSQGAQMEFVCCIYATAPFLAPEHLQRALGEMVKNPEADFVFPVASFESSIFRALTLGNDGAVRMIWPENELSRSQDFPVAWHDAGQFYWGTPRSFRTTAGIFSARAFGVPIPRWMVQDVDTAEDWARAEILYKLMVQSGQH